MSSAGLVGVCWLVEKMGFPWKKTGFSMENYRSGKIVFVAKDSFCHINCEAICQNQACVRKSQK